MRALPESPRLVFREFTADDLDALAGLLADPQVMRFSWHGPRDRAGSRVALAAFQRSYREGSGAGKWALELRATGEFVGYCGFEPCPAGAPAGFELGYRLSPKFWGQGLASEAAEASVRYAFARARLPYLIAFIEPANTASLRVLEKSGFRRVAQDVVLNGKTMDVYRIDAPESRGLSS